MVSDWTRAPTEDGVDGTGVYASRLRSRRSARGPQSPKVLSLVGSTFGAISETEAESTQHDFLILMGEVFWNCLLARARSASLGGESVSSYGISNGLEETPPTRRKRST